MTSFLAALKVVTKGEKVMENTVTFTQKQILEENGKLKERNKNLEMKLQSQIKNNEILRRENSKLDYFVGIIRRCARPEPERTGWFIDLRTLSMEPGDFEFFKEFVGPEKVSTGLRTG